MGNQIRKDNKEYHKVRSKYLKTNFSRMKTISEDYNPLQNNNDWEEIEIQAFHGEITIFNAAQVEKSIRINKDFNLIADDPIYNELLIEHKEEIWRLRTYTLQDFIDWKHLFTLCKRPEPHMSDYCEIDQGKFSKLNKRVWCRNCGLSVCKNCSREKAVLKSLGYNIPQRICNICSEELREGKDIKVSSMISKYKLMSNSLMRASALDQLKPRFRD